MKHLADREIGARAAALVRQRGSPKEKMRLLGADRRTLYAWENGDATPGAYVLQAMARHGYDVLYILTGNATQQNTRLGGGDMKEAVTDSFCEGCWYYRGGCTKTCDYIFLEDRPRPCPPGDGCTVRITRKDRIPMKKPTWDTEAGRQMWQDGKTDTEIADAFGISTGAVTSYRLKHWCDGNSARGGETILQPLHPNKKG